VMLEKETKLTYRRDPDMLERHAGLDARMRSILLDWLIEVSICLSSDARRVMVKVGTD